MSKYISTLLLMLYAFTGIYGQLSRVDLTKDLTAWYAFHGSLESRLPSSPPCLAKGAAWTNNRFGEPEAAVAFGGVDQQLLIPLESIPASSTPSFSISLWIQSLDENPGCILLKEGEYGIKWNGLRKPLTIYHGASGSFLEGKKTQWTAKDWYHLAVTSTGTELALYINGKLDAKWEVESQFEVTQNSLFLGHHPYFWGAFMGKIDDLGIYRRVLNKAEIQILTQLANIPIEAGEATTKTNVALSEFLGTWQGVVIQPDNEMIQNYPFWITLTKTGGTGLSGFTRIEVAEDNAYGVSKAQAYLSGNSLNFEEIQVLRQKNYLGYKWCKKYGFFTYNKADQSLRGKWYADNCQVGGEIILYKTKTKFNYHDNRLSVPVPVDELVAKLEKAKHQAPNSSQQLTAQLDPIVFELNQDNLTTPSQVYLKKALLDILLSNPQVKLNIEGHTDNVGNDQYNLSLSVKRAKRIYEFFLRLGVPEKQLSYQGFGEANPIAPNDTSEGRKKNRRVEFKLST
ncbi:MAG: LamG-like jellyroll fold domain-containing protein [Bacteroidota bacterium]